MDNNLQSLNDLFDGNLEETLKTLSQNDLFGGNLEEVLKTLSQEEAEVIKLRFGLDGNKCHSFAETAQELNMTPKMVRDNENSALKKLRDSIKLNEDESTMKL